MDKNNFANGQKFELKVRERLLDDKPAIDSIKTAYSMDNDAVLDAALWQGNYGKKADLLLELGRKKYGLSIKSYSPSYGFNQLTRMSSANICKKYLGTEHNDYLVERLLVKARKDGQLFPKEEQQKAEKIFKPAIRKLVRDAFALKSGRAILAIVNNKTNIAILYKMSDVFKHLDYKISFTSRGNILVGDCVIIQRKGGDGNVTKFDKTDIRHPANDIQIKLRIPEFTKLMKQYEICRTKVN